MKTILAVITLTATVLSSQALAYDGYRSSHRNEAMAGIEADGQARRNMEELQRIEQAARYRQMELNTRVQQLEQRERIERSDNEWRQRQLEAEQYKPGWR